VGRVRARVFFVFFGVFAFWVARCAAWPAGKALPLALLRDTKQGAALKKNSLKAAYLADSH
jgi:hypothetical protein